MAGNSKMRLDILFISVSILFVFCFLTLIADQVVISAITYGATAIRRYFGSFYLWLGLVTVFFMLVIAILPIGKQKIGLPNEQPAYSFWSWVAMLYSTGMGAGIVLRSVQEPVYMHQHPPVGYYEASIESLEWTFYHWGFTAWAFYGLFALLLAYYGFVKNRPMLLSSLFSSQEIGIRGKLTKIGHLSINSLAVITTVIGVMAAVALGANQLVGGLNHVFSMSLGFQTGVFLVLLITFISFLSAWGGITKGIKRLSEWNMLATLAVLLFVLIFGSFGDSMTMFLKSLYFYVVDFVKLSLALDPFNPQENFLYEWTYFYWAFWIAWAPFTGMFIARISRGRTIRELVLGVLFIPALGTFLWFAVFGQFAFSLLTEWGAYHGEFDNVFSAIFCFFDYLPMSLVMHIVLLFLVGGFLITSVDSAVYVLSIFSSGGASRPPKNHRFVWSLVVAVFTVSILFLSHVAISGSSNSGVLTMLQKLLIITSLPFGIVMVYMMVSFLYEQFFSRKV